MTDWRDPDVVNAEYLAFIKLLHVMGGLYIWEYVTTFGFEWSVITRKRKYRWTIWLYSGCRLSALTAIVVIFIGFNVTKPINCEAWLVCVFLFAYTAFLFASALIILRIYAIWDRNLHITALAVVAWLTNAAFYLHNIIMSRSVWNPESPGCVVLYTDRSRENVIVTLVTDMVQLVLMLWGLVRYGNAGTFNGLWRLLYNQGLLWLVIVTVAEIPPTVFIVLNLNDPLNLMFQTPELIIMSIGATRIYRALADYGLMTEFNVVSER
ncbi:hypothetical protein BV25DRAFT_1494434 [Artomyces pyxidatus]|uniref:Uncharacterized protein n=1 Tax=Artomyces pyxidatus TaxID=48021 RepID=A0ACB8TCF8_9AGAM|nr:hypothetical protein BV25DRAFT_1494434 [Artomyces pyxidatus]